MDVVTRIGAGSTIAGKFRVVRELGKGGSGVVLAAEDLESGAHVAVKVLADDKALDRELVMRFQREARAAARLDSPHVVRILDVGEIEHAVPYLVMEALDGRPLSALLAARAPIAVVDAVDWVLQACAAVAEAHRHGIVHRDLKPANLFLVEAPHAERFVKVLDFGAAKVTTDSDVFHAADGVTTLPTSLLGSPRYMAPEQLKNATTVDERIDVYGLGATLHELLTGEPLFVAESVAKIFERVLFEAPPPTRAARPEIPPALDAIVAKCLAKRREDRFASVVELGRALAPLLPPERRKGWDMNDRGEHEKETLAPPPGAEDVYAAPTLSVHQSDSDIRRLLDSTREDHAPVLRITIPPRRRIRPAFIALIAVALGLLVGVFVAWWHMSR